MTFIIYNVLGVNFKLMPPQKGRKEIERKEREREEK
jgi:hypothetical protein